RSIPLFVILGTCGVLAAQAQWSAPVLETTLNSTSSETGPFLTLDGKTLYFASNRNQSSVANYEIYSVTRAGRGQPSGTPVLESTLNDPTATDDQPCVSADGLELYFNSTRAGGMGGIDIMVSTRSSTSQPWGTPTFATALNSTANDGGPTLTADGLRIY